MYQGTFSDILIRLEAFKKILSGIQKSTFFQGVGPGFLVRNDQTLKSVFLTCFCP